ncbi:MAG: T9SS type A sorting domain-containing protein [Flavobacterium sp.]|uniref:Ig-like domain-containing protein n=1 Tax=Flavobacterium sp. TaxID=239 RepID=UPI00378FC397
MKKNYFKIDSIDEKYSSMEITNGKVFKQLKTLLVLFLIVFGISFSSAQTTLISPTGDGGFENGSTFAANGWTAVNASTDGWVIGSVPVVSAGTNCGYVSANGGTSWTYSQFSTYTHIYKDFTIPAGENVLTLKFKWKATGEGTTTSDWDNMKVFVAPTTVVPVNTAAVTGATQLSGSGAISGMYKLNSAAWNSETIVLSGTPGTTYRLIFSWKSDSTAIANPPSALDEIELISRAPGTFISVVTGNWNTGSTWDAGTVPTALDSAIISAGHIVTADAATTNINNLTVNGTLAYASAATSVTVGGNLTVNAGGLINVFNGTTGKTLAVAGNITNDGRIDVSVGSTTGGTLTLNGSTVQTVVGTGTFGGTVTSTTTTNTANVIRNLIINNTSTAIPNVIWSFNDVKVAYNLTLTSAKINLGTNKLIFGNYAAGNTLSASASNGILPGGKFSRWWTAGATGSLVTAGTDPTNGTSRYPLISATGAQRAMYITRTNSTGAVAGELAVVYTDAATTTTGLSIVDGAYTITDRYDGNWSVTNEGTAVSASSYTLVLFANNALYPSNGNARVMGASTALSGTHQNGTTTPGAQRITVSQTDLLAAPLYIGIAAADVPFVSIANGDWNATTTWNKGTVPTCADNVTIASGHTVTVNTLANVAKGVTITAGGTLAIASGDLTVGCTLNNNTLINNGTLTVSGGILNVNGSVSHNSGATFNQSGGDINIDGNAAGVTANSATSYHLNLAAVVNWTGGTLTIVDPHASTTSTDVLYYNLGTSSNVGTGHTLRFGDGISTDAGGNAIGFKANTYVGSGRINYGNLVINGGSGTNRIVTGGTYSNVVLGNLTINSSSEYAPAVTVFVAGDFVNNGTFTQTSTLTLSSYVGTTSAVSTNSQTISGSGVFRNLATSPTANLNSLTVNNSNATGVTLNVPLSVSGTLTMTSGIINTTNTNLLSLGTATAAGTLSGTPSATNMVKGPFARTIASGNTNSTYVLFPVGKTGYAPVSLAPATTAVTVMKAEAFDSNTGTQNAAITNMTTARRWEAPIVSGTLTDLNVRLGDAGILATSIPVQAPSAAGEYTNSFGSVATAVVGATTQSNAVVTSANYTGFLSYADSNACSGTPSPGNTLASTNSICLGATVNLSLQNVTSGTGVTYQWKSSTDGIAYTAISGATNATLSVTPSVSTYYVCDVTCSAGPSTGTSTAVQIIFSNSIASTTPGTRCGTGTVDLGATASAGATVKWYSAITGGTALGTGTAFTTPSIAATTTYYAGAEVLSVVNQTLGSVAALSTSFSTSSTNGGMVFTTTVDNVVIKNADIFVSGTGDMTFELQNSSGTTIATTTITGVVGSSTTLTNIVFPSTFTIPTSGTGYRLICTSKGASQTWYYQTGAYPFSTNGVSITGGYGWSSATTYSTDLRCIHKINFDIPTICSSERVAVNATVTTPPTFALSSNSATICSGSTSTPAITVATGASDYDTYAWNPSTGVSGNATIGWTFNPTVTTTYTLTASQSGGALCSTTATVDITVNASPTLLAITPSSVSTCVNSIQSLVASGGTIGSNGTSQIGTATTLTSSTGQPTAFCNRYKHYWSQMVYTAAELTAAGVQPGNINAISFKTGAQGSANNVTDFKVRLGNTTNNTLTGFTTTGLTQVYSAATYSTVVGVNTITFDTPYVWDGTSNIIVDMRQTGIDDLYNSTTEYTATTGNTVVYAITSTTNAGGSDGYATSAPSATTSLNRLNTTFVWNNSQSTAVTWSPDTDLYTDAAATNAYVLGTPATTVYFKSSVVGGPINYTATSTSVNGCTSSAVVPVTVNALPTVVTNNPAAVCSPASVDLTATAVTTGSDLGLTYTYWTDLAATSTLANPNAVSTSGTYYIKGQNANGCSVVQAVTVTVNALPTVVINNPVAVCSPASVDLTASAVTTGSDLGLTFTYWTDLAATSVLANPSTVSTSGTYYIKGENANGCSVIQAVNVTINVPTSNSTTASACDSYIWSVDGLTYTASGTYTNISTNAQGCTHTETLNLTITPSTSNSTTASACDSYVWAVDGATYTASGTYTNVVGCHTETLNLTINPLPNNATTQSGDTLTATETGATYQWVLCDGSFTPISGAVGQSYLVTAIGSYAVEVTSANGCMLRSACINVTTLSGNTFDLTNLTYYPNPVVDFFTIKYNKEIQSINVFDLSGRLVRQLNPKQLEAEVDMSELAAAMYIVKVDADGKQTEIKVIKK